MLTDIRALANPFLCVLTNINMHVLACVPTTMIIRHQPCMPRIHRPPLRATIHLHAAYNHQGNCRVTPPPKHASGHSNAIKGERASWWHSPASSACKRARRGALLHHPAARSARLLACLLSLRFTLRIPYTAVRTSRARSSSQDEVSSS
jgi:hypothetical protein